MKNIDTAKSFITTANSIVQSLAEVNPRDDEFDDLLLKHERLCRTALQYMDLQERVSFFLGEMAEIENDNAVTIPVNAKVSKITPITASTAKEDPKPAEEHPVEQPFPEPEPAPETTDDPKPITLDEVKAEFVAAAREGIKVSEIIEDTGYSKLSDVPADLYAALLRTLARKRNGEE